MAALIFDRPPATSGRLVFGETDDSAPIADVPIRLVCVLPGLTMSARMQYVSGAQRPTVAEVRARFQDADPSGELVRHRWQESIPMRPATSSSWQRATARPTAGVTAWRDAQRSARLGPVARYQDAQQLHEAARSAFAQAQQLHEARSVDYQDAIRLQVAALAHFQDAARGIAGQHRIRYQDAIALAFGLVDRSREALHLARGTSSRYQEATQPKPGQAHLGPTHPPEPPIPCYLPDATLVFGIAPSTSGALLFYCDGDGTAPIPVDPTDPEPSLVVVPVRRFYLVFNSASLRRVDGDVAIPATSLQLGLDADSWTWTFSARVPGSALPLLEPSSTSGPVEVEARINGVAYRFLVEGLSRDRSYGRSDLSVSGRGRAALLDSPYVPPMVFGNPGAARTAQQLALDALTINGVPLGWEIDWRPVDWLIPAGTWSHQGTYISALNAIASAAGGYVQPHRTAQRLAVELRYPVKPWDWHELAADYELPADVVSREGIAWQDRPLYNRVIVSGVDAGSVQGIATRAGTAGDIEAPSVTDRLITTEAAARQRAIPVLSNVGRQAEVSLRLPVLAETGIIPPGKFVRYVDAGESRIGLVRSTSASVDRSEESLTIWQTLGVETHVSL